MALRRGGGLGRRESWLGDVRGAAGLQESQGTGLRVRRRRCQVAGADTGTAASTTSGATAIAETDVVEGSSVRPAPVSEASVADVDAGASRAFDAGSGSGALASSAPGRSVTWTGAGRIAPSGRWGTGCGGGLGSADGRFRGDRGRRRGRRLEWGRCRFGLGSAGKLVALGGSDACIHRRGSCIHRRGSCIHRRGGCIHRRGSGPFWPDGGRTLRLQRGDRLGRGVADDLPDDVLEQAVGRRRGVVVRGSGCIRRGRLIAQRRRGGGIPVIASRRGRGGGRV